jgi:catechol 2,3-dioxygenase-like lactoylglutathione lyase family enzyme
VYFPTTLIHIGVTDASRSTRFYEALFGERPTARGDHAAVFEIDSPPLVLTIESFGGARSASRKAQRRSPQAFAVAVPEPELVGKVAVALWRAGARLRLLDQAIEARDPDGNLWAVRLDPRVQQRAIVALGAVEGAA